MCVVRYAQRPISTQQKNKQQQTTNTTNNDTPYQIKNCNDGIGYFEIASDRITNTASNHTYYTETKFILRTQKQKCDKNSAYQ